MPKACTIPGAIANTALTRLSCTSSAGGGIEHAQRQMAAALVRVDVFELPDADRKGGAVVRALRERSGGPRRQQRASKRCATRGNRPPLDGQEKFPDEDRRTLAPHAPVLPSIVRECKRLRGHRYCAVARP